MLLDLMQASRAINELLARAASGLRRKALL